MIFDRDFNDLTEEDIKLLNSYFDGYDYESSTHTFWPIIYGEIPMTLHGRS